jgi:pilus assembly protein CpaB
MKKMAKKVNKSTIQIVGIVLLSVVTATSVYVYTSGIESRVRAQQDLIPTLIVGQAIPVGMSLSAAFSNGMIDVKRISRQSLPTLAIQSINDTNGALVALHPLEPGQFITTPNFGTKAVNNSALEIPRGMLAMTVTIGEPEKVGSFLQPGSEIAIFGTAKPLSGGGQSQITKVLFPQITVIAVGNQISANTATVAPSSTSSLITVAVTPLQAIKLVHAVRTVTLYFALRSEGVDFNQLISVTDADIIG